MAINANHPFEELNGIRCAVVEKNCSPERVSFLKYILEGNGFDVVVAAAPPPKAAAAAPKPAAPVPPAESSGSAVTALPAGSSETNTPPTPEQVPVAPELFTVGVSDVTFNVINAIYGRLLRSPDGRVVTMAYWQQKEQESRDDLPYYSTGS